MNCLLHKSIVAAGMLLILFGGAGEARASFTDSDGRTATFSVGTVDFMLESEGVRTPQTLEFSGASASKSFELSKTGTLPFSYDIKLQNISGNTDFCNSLQVSLARGGENAFSGALEPRISSSSYYYGEGGAPWVFQYSETTTSSESKLCVFDLVFSARQANITEGSGFTKDRTVTIMVSNNPVSLNAMTRQAAENTETSALHEETEDTTATENTEVATDASSNEAVSGEKVTVGAEEGSSEDSSSRENGSLEQTVSVPQTEGEAGAVDREAPGVVIENVLEGHSDPIPVESTVIGTIHTEQKPEASSSGTSEVEAVPAPVGENAPSPSAESPAEPVPPSGTSPGVTPQAEVASEPPAS